MADVVAADHSEECWQKLLYERVKLQVYGPYMLNRTQNHRLVGG